jgi:tetratricopeptide (TPR) repeat protein
VRINVQLIDATTGGHLWAERYDGTLEDVFDLQDNVTKRIVDALALELTPEETRTVGDIGTENIAAHDAYLLGLSYYHRRTPEDNATARTHFEMAIELDPDYSTAYTALAKVYAQAAIGGPSYSEKLRIDNFQGYVKVWQLLDQGMSEPNADYYVLRSWLALRKHLHDRAIAEAEKALELNPNDAEAMEALAEALIYAGQPKAGIEFAEKAIRQNPTSLGRALYLMATAEFALGDSAKALEYLDRAIQKAPNEKYFTGLLTAVHGDLGHVEQAKAAFNVFDEYEQYEHGIIRLAGMVALYPFSDPDVLERLANGFKAGGVSVGIGGYLPLHSENQLSGQEIKSLLFGKEIKGHWFWFKGGEDGSYWRQPRTVDGGVRHFGFQIHQYLRSGASGVGRIENDMLCERWGNLAPELEICVVIFRVTDPLARARWGDYVMVTEAGPQPFNVVE